MLLGTGVITDAHAATIYKCVSGGHVTYSNISADCASADKTETLVPVPVEKYPLNLGVPKAMGTAAHVYLRGMNLTIPRYTQDTEYYGSPIYIKVPDLSLPEYLGIR